VGRWAAITNQCGIIFSTLLNRINTNVKSSHTYRVHEIRALINDTLFFRSLLSFLINSKHGSVISFNAIPFLSLYVVESQKYLISIDPTIREALEESLGFNFKEFIETSRNRIKLFEENSGIEEIALRFDNIVKSQKEAFNREHTGLLGWLKRLLQDDIGIYVFNDNVINTTHTVVYNLGLESYTSNSQISQLMLSVSQDIGKYTETLFQAFVIGHNGEYQEFFQQDTQKQIRSIDRKSDRYYPLIFKNPEARELNALLTLLFPMTNFLAFGLSQITSRKSETAFKLKFVGLYHIIHSLSNLQDYYYNSTVLSTDSKHFLKVILSSKEVKLIKKKQLLRNILVHYEIRGIPEAVLDETKPFSGIVEHLFNGATFDEVETIIDEQLARVGSVLQEWSSYPIK